MSFFQSITKKPNETRIAVVSFAEKLVNTAELIDAQGLSAIELRTTALTVGTPSPIDADFVYQDRIVHAGQAVEVSIGGGVSRKDYTVRVTVQTNGSPVQTLVEDLRVHVL
jgi:hypothetical protein